MAKYTELSKKTLSSIGGIENISNVTHCATRLRINYIDENLIDEDSLNVLPDISAAVIQNGQIQLIIGPNVNQAYNEFLKISQWNDNFSNNHTSNKENKKGFQFYVNKFGSFMAAVFMPIVPALITGGIILAFQNILINYFGIETDSGTAKVLMAIFYASFTFLPIYIGYTLSRNLNMDPILGALLGGILVSPAISGVKGLDFLGFSIPTVDYGSSVFPIFLGIFFMYFVNKLLVRIIPETLSFFLKPLLTMLIVVPITLIFLGPIGTRLSGLVGAGVVSIGDVIGTFATPILAALYPYLVMFGLDKTLPPLKIQLVAEVGFDPFITASGFISNISVGASAMAIASSTINKAKKGVIYSSGITALFGITEPAFYGSLILKPKTLVGVACGSIAGGLVAGTFKLYAFIAGAAPGLSSFVFFINTDGSFDKLFLGIIVAIVTIIVSFGVTKIIIIKEHGKL